ncbi:MAG: POTRA domain-containing protein [Terriglobia bacterium]
MSWNEIRVGPDSLIRTHRSPLSRCRFSLFGVLFLHLFTPFLTGAAIDPFVGMKITRIEFSSPDPIQTKRLYSTISLAVGDVLETATVRRSIENLYKTREFANIEVDAARLEEGLVITFKLRPNFFFADFRISGEVALRSTLSNLVQLPIGEIYSHKVVDDLASTVSQAYRDSGYYQATVHPDIQFQPESHLVSVNYHVQPGLRATVESIKITGSPQLEEKEILAKIKLRPGQVYRANKVRRSLQRIRKMYSERGFLNANIRLESVQYDAKSNSVQVRIFIDSGSFVYIELTGGKISRKTLRQIVPIYEEGSIDSDLIEEGRKNVEDYFKRKGYFDVTVTSEFIEVPAQRAYQINYNIDRGTRQRVVSVTFPGAAYFDRKQLLAPLQTQPGSLTSKGRFSPELMQQDAERLRDLYVQDGFEDIQITPSYENDPSGVNVAVRFQINEGKQTFVSQVTLAGNSVLTNEELLKATSLKAGSPFSSKKLDEDRRVIESKLLELGYPDAAVESKTQRSPEQKIEIHYAVSEGVKFQVGDVYVVGNRLTHEKSLRTTFFMKAIPQPRKTPHQPAETLQSRPV